MSDPEIMKFAKNNNFVLLTQDLDFTNLLAAPMSIQPSVVQIRAENAALDIIGKTLVHALRQMETALNEGVLVTINTSKVRINILPVKSKDSDRNEEYCLYYYALYLGICRLLHENSQRTYRLIEQKVVVFIHICSVRVVVFVPISLNDMLP